MDRTKYELGLFLFEKAGLLLGDVPADVRVHVGRASQKRLRYEIPQLAWNATRTVARYDILVACSPSATFLLNALKPIHRKDWTAWVHFNYAQFMPSIPKLKSFFYSIAYKNTRNLVAVSAGALSALTEQNVANFESSFVYNILDEAAYNKPSQCLETLLSIKRKYSKPTVVFVGRLSAEKGGDSLVRTAAILSSKPDAPVFVIIGGGAEEPRLKAEVERLRLGDVVHFVGPDSNPYPCIAAADALVMCSRHEALPTVILESFLAGTPVISFDSPTGPRELLGESENGLLVQNGNCEELALRIQALLHNAAMRQQYIERGRLALSPFSPANITQQWDEIFKRMAQRDHA
jgi:glycosyltransferase involved in cell wall biosynthesis